MRSEQEIRTFRDTLKAALPNQNAAAVSALNWVLGEAQCLDMGPDFLKLSIRSTNALEHDGIKTIGELVSKSANQLLACKNFGHTSLNEIREALARHGLSLRGEAAPLPLETT